MKDDLEAAADKTGAKREGSITPGLLRAFVAIAETGSFSQAAAQLGVAQPTVSIQLTNLEQSCGVLLLHRRPRVKLTEAGCEVFLRARQILSRLDGLEAYARDMQHLERGSLAVGTSTPAFAMPLLSSFMVAQPAIAIRTTIGNTSELIDDLAQCRIDVAVMTLQEPVPNMRCTLLFPQRLMACVPVGADTAARTEIHIAELAGHPLVMREQGSMTRKLLETAMREKGLAPRVRLEVGSREAVIEAVAAGLGSGILLEGEVRSDTRLHQMMLAGTSIVGGVYAVTLKEGADIPAINALLEHAVHAKVGARAAG
ncbi:LysR substrate-binding domain-containing protein [Bordetella genomosp. 13]|uniref:HTH lysR-type domain-containing protein n=1 Tax=Bordetella genomosp. 13 TaxID=463040 RepID=A0A1W6Z8D8_9BORD|nr:LysR substrate-binding domain-containing protein [Bordetella genomosp. 13]ARP93512.1 hypothetical protein CAL15_03430 [Bordetella genomosp. 13]